MAAAVHLRFDAHARLAAHVQRTDTLGTIGLVGRERHEVDLELLQVDHDLAGGLRRVDVENDALLAADLADGLDVLHHADFIVDHHHRHQDGVRAQRRLEGVQADQTVFLHVEVRHLETLALEFAAGVQHRLVLGLDRDDVLAALGVEIRRALDGQVVGLGGAGGPDDFARIGVDQPGDLGAGVFHGLFGLPAEGVAARGRVAEMLIQPGHHLVDHARVDRRGGRVVQIDRKIAHDAKDSCSL